MKLGGAGKLFFDILQAIRHIGRDFHDIKLIIKDLGP